MKLYLGRINAYINATILISIAFYFFLAPVVMLVSDIHDPSLANGQMPKLSYRLHKQISEKFEIWANERTTAGAGASMDVFDISGTEWPMFSAVFYLWATEALHQSSNLDASRHAESPLQYSLPAIEAAAALIVDPNNAAWVKKHWGDEYLTTENIFYRMLLISGLVSYQQLSGNSQYQQLLATQVESLAAEIDASPYGLLDDYPHQCYPIDVLPAIAAIKRADVILGTDHSEFVQRSLRAFEGNRLDPKTLLPTYIANSRTGQGSGPARGVGISYMLIWAPQLWLETTNEWYDRFDQHFWQRGFFTASIREFSKYSNHSNWTIDVDAGPVFAGIGTAASAFGVGASRVNGRFDQAYALSAEALVASWPLPDGTLLAPRLLSNLSDAPYVGETALLFSFTRMPHPKAEIRDKLSLPLVVYLGLLTYLLAGLILVRESTRRIRNARQSSAFKSRRFFAIQNSLWSILIVLGVLFLLSGAPMKGIFTLFLASFFPRLNNR